jgi:FemAB-related protein (PEP-CTERM system-associated)
LTDYPAVTVKRLLQGEVSTALRWDQFVFACPAATFFHRSGWQRIIENVFRHETCFLYAERAGRIEGVLALAHISSWLFGNSTISLPFAVYGGVAAANEDAAGALENEAQLIAEGRGAACLELRNIDARHPDWPKQDLYVTFRKEILPEVDANMLAIPRKQRAMVRKGMKQGLRSEIDQDSERFFPLYANNVHRHGTPAMPRKYFQALIDEFKGDCEILTVLGPEGQVLSSVLSFYFRDEVLPYYAGDDESARNLAANDFKYWELMRRACEKKLRVFDYGRSKQGTGSFAFKKNWGFEPRPLHYEFCLYKRDAIPQNNPANVKYQLMIAVWRRLPIGFANWLGPFVVRSLG